MGNTQVNVLVKNIITENQLDTEEFLEEFDGVLLCEGTETSVDVLLYQGIYPYLKVIPVGGWSDVLRLQPMIRKRLKYFEIPVFGIIDRDSRSKGEIKKLKEKGIYCTKLPFIENLISCPEVIMLFSENKHIDGEKCVNSVQRELMLFLSQRLRDALPLNIPLNPNDEA